MSNEKPGNALITGAAGGIGTAIATRPGRRRLPGRPG